MNFNSERDIPDLAKRFSEASGKSFDLYGVEHVFWFHGRNPYRALKGPVLVGSPTSTTEAEEDRDELSGLPDSYIPPIVAVLPRLARNEPSSRESAKTSGTSLERAYEKSISAAFTILGYETKLLGQGQGRVPDGLAVDSDNSYAVLWDAKVRTDGYSIGTDDRAIKEYIVTQSRELKRRRAFRNVYYLVVSSAFSEDYDDVIRSIKMETDVNEVCLVEAEAMVAMVDARLRAPLQVSLGPDGLQRLFSASGVLTADDVRKTLG